VILNVHALLSGSWRSSLGHDRLGPGYFGFQNLRGRGAPNA